MRMTIMMKNMVVKEKALMELMIKLRIYKERTGRIFNKWNQILEEVSIRSSLSR